MLLFVGALLLAGVPAVPLTDGAEPFAQRQLQYLRFATSSPLAPASVLNVMNHLELASRQPNSSFALEPNTIRADAWDGFINKPIGNFGMLWILNALYAFDGDPAAEPGLWERAKQTTLDFKYWFVDPDVRAVDGEPVALTDNSTEYCARCAQLE